MSLSGTGISDSEKLFDDAPKWIVAVMIISLFLIFAGYFILFVERADPGKALVETAGHS